MHHQTLQIEEKQINLNISNESIDELFNITCPMCKHEDWTYHEVKRKSQTPLRNIGLRCSNCCNIVIMPAFVFNLQPLGTRYLFN